MNYKNMQRSLHYLLFFVLLLQAGFVNAQSELWGTDYWSSAIFKFDGNNPGPANFVKKLAMGTAGAANPWAGLTLYSNGKLYGTTHVGGSSNLGVLFEYDPATGILTKKVDFVGINGNGAQALTLAANGKLYGTTSQGGVSNDGVLFEYDPVTNTYTKKVDFDGTLKGSVPGTTLTPAPNGKLYGMTTRGGAFSFGVLFEYDPVNSTYTKRVDFSGTANGANPRSGPLAVGGNGKLYGVTYDGGTSNGGVLFEFDPSTNVFTKKVDFINGGVAGSNPCGGLVLAGNGKLYGTTFGGDPSTLGVLFEYDYATNSYAVKHDFLYDDAGQEVNAGLTLGGNGKLYGVTTNGGGLGDNGSGALFEYDPTSNTYTTKMQFSFSDPDHPKGVYSRLLYAQTQTITGFAAIPNKTYGDAPFTVSATGGASGNPVTFISSDPAVAMVSGNTVTIVGAGTATITAWQAGNTTYLSAPNVAQNFTVNRANQAITFGPLADKGFGDAPFALTGSASSGLPVTYTSSNTAVATISGSTVTIVGAGTTTITASQPGNVSYNAATNVLQTLTVVTKQNQTISFGALATKTFGDAPFALTGTTSSGLPVTYTSSNTAVATVSGSTVTIVGGGTTTITASQAGSAGYNVATPISQTLTVNPSNQTITFSVLADKTFGDASFALTGTASSGLAVTYTSSNTAVATVSENTLTIVGAGTTTITASHGGNANFNAAADVPQILTVNKKNQVITFGALSTKTFGDIPLTVTTTGGTSGNAIILSSSNTSVATVSGSTITIVGAGATTITASQAGNANYNAAIDVPQTLTVNKASQSIIFNALGTKTMGDAPFVLSATGGASGNAVIFISSNTAVATILGNVVTIVGAGSTTITASQAGNTNYNAAPDVPQSLTVNKGNQAITFGALSSKTFGDAPFTLTGTASSALAVSYVSSNTGVATVSGNTVTIVGAGSTTITASQAGNANYNVATSVPQNLTVNKADQAITFNALPDKLTSDAPFNLTATATLGLTVSYASSNTSVATVSGNTVTIVGAGTTTITASQAGNTNYNAATSVPQNLSVSTSTVKSDQTITFNTLLDKNVGDAFFNLTATASSGLTVSYASSNTSVATISGNTVTIVGGGTTTITASQVGNANFNAAVPVTQTLTINKSNQTITFSALADKNVGDANFNLAATASSGLPVSYTSSNPFVAIISGSTVTIVRAGTTIITASQAGDPTYNAATSVTRTLTVTKSDQTISFFVQPILAMGSAPFDLTASATSGLPVTYTSSNTGVATISGSQVTLVGPGTTIITASQAGDDNFNAAVPVSRTITVNKVNQFIANFNPPQLKNTGDAAFNLTAAATPSGLPVSYMSSNPSVASISGSTVTILQAGTVNITATQSGNAIYNAAPPEVRMLIINKQDQSINFPPLFSVITTQSAFDLNATSNSGLPVTYTSSNTSVATVSGSTVTIKNAGTTIITASQPGNATYNAAAPVTQTLTVTMLSQSITFGPLASKKVGDPAFNLTATSSSGLEISYDVDDHSVATISGSTINIVGAGTAKITAYQWGDPNYYAATPVSQVLTVNKSDQTITFNALADKNIGDEDFNLTATASSSLTVSYSSSNSAVATVSASTVTIVGIGTTIITASQTGNGSYNAATPVSRVLTVNKANQTITFNALADKNFGDASFNLSATASSSLAISYSSSNPTVATVVGNVVTIVGAGTTTITASQAGNSSYSAAPDVSQSLTVSKAGQTITFGSLSSKTFGDALFMLTGTASSGLGVSYISSNTSVATVSGNIVTILGAGSTTITATQAGNGNYNAAASVPQTLTVNKADQVITFPVIADKLVSDAPFNLTATSSSGLPVTYVNGNSAVATLSAGTVTIVGGGTTAFLARQNGNSNYNAATPVAQGLTVNRITQNISNFTYLSAKTAGDAPFTLTATASSGLPVTYMSSDPSVATISGSTVTIVGAGSATISAAQGGNDTYAPAVTWSLPFTVAKMYQAISFVDLTTKTVGDAPFSLTATASSGLPLTYSSNNPSVATISGNTVTLVGAGTAAITATQAGNSNYIVATPASRLLTVNKLNQIITFDALAVKTVGDAMFNLTATADSGLPVSFTSSNPSVATVSGGTVTIVGGGSTIITALQSGDATYNAAIAVTQMLTVNKSNQTITFAALADKNVGDANFNLTATASSSLAVSYTSSNTAVAAVSGNSLTIVGAGTAIITASQSGNSSYNAATPVSQTLTVNKSNQTITFTALADKNVGDASFNLTATASSSLAASYTSSNTSVATVSGNTVTIVGTGTTIITASQSGNSSYNAATPVTQTLTVNKSNQAITFNALTDKNVGDATFNLTATASSTLAVSYTSSNPLVATISGGTITIVGAGTTIITASQVGNGSYNAATPVTQTLTVNKSNQTITFSALADKNVGDPTFNLTATASSTLAVSYTSSNSSVATISGSTVTIVGGGTTIITASQTGNANYNAATAITQTLTVNKSNQTITFNVLANKVFGDPDFTLTAAASSGLVVSYISSNTSVANVSGSTITIVGPGTTVITASQSGNASFYAAATVSQPFTVTAGSKADQTISFAALPDKIFGDGSFNLTATTSSGLPVTYASSNESVATISGNTVTIVGAGITIITASQPGNTSYNTAIDVPRTLTIGKTSQTVTFSALANKTFGDPAFTLTATTSSGLPVSYASSNPSVAVLSGSTVTILGAGTSVITAFQSGNSNYDASDDVLQTLTVNKKDQTITFTSLADKTVGDAGFSLSAVTTSGLPVTYASSDPSVATLSGNLVTIVGAGTTVITASQSGNTNYNTAMEAQQTLTVNAAKADQTITFHALADKIIGDATFDLTATSSSGLPVAYVSSNPSVATISGNTLTIMGVGTTIITASQPGNASYNAAITAVQSFRVKKMSQSIVFDALANRAPGDEPFDLSATASSGLTVNYSSSNSSVATVSGATVTVVGTGTTIITASQPGDASHDAAMDVARALTVTSTKTDQTITFNTLNDKTFGDATFNLTATTTSGLAVSYATSNPLVATISGSTVTITGVGTTMITASQSGNAIYNPAVAVSRTLTVNKKDQSISFSTLNDKTVGDAVFNLTATASSGLAVSYSSASDKVVLTGENVNVVKPGRATIIASQTGNAGYKEAVPVSRSFCIRPVKPTITVSNADTESPILISNAPEGNQWFLNDAVIPDATNATLQATQPGVYKVQVKVDDCVSDFSTDKPLVVTGNVENYDDNMNIEVYPNPASDWLHVSLGGLRGKKDITIFHLNGIETTSQQVDGDEARFHVEDYASGMYVVKVKSGNKVRLIRFIKL